VQPGDDLSGLITDALGASEATLRPHDVVVVAQKIVSRSEDRFVDLRQVEPSPRALALAAKVGKAPPLVEVILRESRSVVRAAPGVLIVETALGFVCANAGVDSSNVAADRHIVLLLPENPDASAHHIRLGLEAAFDVPLSCLVADSHGRPWRKGTVGVAIGASGIRAVRDHRGRHDLYGRKLQTSTEGTIDELASAATLLMGQADEAVPVVVVRGLTYERAFDTAVALQRPRASDLFR
jgi:coenzyme F420-0:L-glutamate ligase/coenzyme F420-1:gamma-L-glutamate ligase